MQKRRPIAPATDSSIEHGDDRGPSPHSVEVRKWALILCLQVAFSLGAAGSAQTLSPHTGLNPQIPPAINRSVVSPWPNPELHLSLTGVLVSVRGDLVLGPIEPEKLSEVLRSLPIRDWPRGRVVLLRTDGRFPLLRLLAEPEDPNSRAVQLLKGVRAVLESLDIKEIDTPVN